MNRGRWWYVGLVCVAVFLLSATGASAATIHVTLTTDPDNTTGSCATNGPCSLREAINAAGNGDTVSVPAGEYDLTRSDLLTIATNITLSGAGAGTTTVKQTNTGRNVINVSSGLTVTIQGVTITGGHSGGGLNGGGIADAGTLTVVDSAVVGNEVDGYLDQIQNPPDYHAAVGGGIAVNNGSLTIIRSTISGNHAEAHTGANAYGGGIESIRPVTVINSTIAGNFADGTGGAAGIGAGGGIYMGADAFAQLTLANATVARNTATGQPAQGGNIYLVNSNAGVTVKNSVIADGTADSGSENCFGASGQLSSQGYNVEDRNECALNGTGDRVLASAKLGPLKNNGGSTNTVALLTGSPAINHGDPSGCTDPTTTPNVKIPTDQRGFHRPQGKRCDSGAFEFRMPVLKGLPRISGTPKVGQKLTCLLPAVQSPDGAVSISVAWLRNGASVAAGRTYVVRSADKGHSLSCRVRAANSAGAAAATSRAVSVR
jgi:CSLREA domain-containing protein